MYLIGETSFWLKGASWLAMFKVAIGLGLVIFVHELGHFLVAKACGVKCEKFYIGFDAFDIKFGKFVLIPRALVKFQWGETEYGVGVIPLGGYVKMLGQDDNPANAEKEAERTRIRKTDSDDSAEATGEAADSEAKDSAGQEEEFELDPRSYTAKSVPQRMAIISAGVIMNLIFAVIFGTWAYWIGVEYTPCEIGSVVAGGPADRQGIRAGNMLVGLDEKSEPSLFLRFMWDLRQAVGMAGVKEDVKLLVRQSPTPPAEMNDPEKQPDAKDVLISMRAKAVKIRKREMPSIGIVAVSTNLLSETDPVMDFFPLGEGKEKKFKGGDTIIAVTTPDGKVSVEKNHYRLKALLVKYADVNLTFTVKRKIRDEKGNDTGETESIDVVAPPNRMKRLGLVMETGPIDFVRPGTPAEKAGFQRDDVIKTIDGKPIADPMALPNLLRSMYGREIQVEVVRSKSKGEKGKNETETIALTVTPQAPGDYLGFPTPGTRPFLSLPSLGVVMTIPPRVKEVLADSPAAKGGLQTGDEIIQVQFLTTDEKEKNEKELINAGKPLDLDDYSITWPVVHGYLQYHEPHTQIKLIYKRGDDRGDAAMVPEVLDQQEFNPDRGFVFAGKKKIRKAKSLGEAFALGLRQTKEDSLRIVYFLRKLVTGQISVTNLGGPGTIAVVATSEASQGTSRLLMFLVLISANLAVVNFLPIPVLDGGHMMFLIAEGIMRKPVSEKLQMALTLVGLVFVLGLMLFVIGLDVVNLSGLGG